MSLARRHPGAASRYVRRLVQSTFEYDDIVVLSAPSPTNCGGAPEVVANDDPTRIVELYRALGRMEPPARIAQRLALGLRFYFVDETPWPAAVAWLLPSGHRFVDEIGYQLPVPPHSVWLRDVVVSPAARGRRLFASFITQTVRAFHPAARSIWSDFSRGNVPSARAHASLGFREVGSMRMLHVAGAFMLRSPPPPALGVESGFALGRRALITGSRFQAYVAKHLA